MELGLYFRSVLEQDRAAVVICDTEHRIVYMNPAAVKNYEKWGGAALLGRNLMDCHGPASREMIRRVTEGFAARSCPDIVFTTHNAKQNKDVYMVALRDPEGNYIGYYEKHEYRDAEQGEPYAGV